MQAAKPRQAFGDGLARKVDVAILGAGFGGLCMAIKLREAGNHDFVILEKGPEVGGTWRDNTYPGAACDVQSHLYSYSFEGKPDWSQRYAPWQEIQSYLLDTTEKHGIRPFVLFEQEVKAARFDATSGRWELETAKGLRISARHFVMASGPLHEPSIPDLPGLGSFAGRVFHSARWDHDYDLRDKRVISIGTGGSAIQYVPEIAPEVKHLSVFQRTPAWVFPRDDRAYTKLERTLFGKAPAVRKLHRAQLYWANESRVWPLFHPKLAWPIQQLARLHIWRNVNDPALARRLTPDYTMGCKRILISNAYYPTFNRANVELVTSRIREVNPHGIVTDDGVQHPADCIILGTGFVTDPRAYMKGFECTGLGGRDLLRTWRAGAEAYYGISVSGYPNMYQLLGPNTLLGHNSVIFMIEAQVRFIMDCMHRLRQRGAGYACVRASAQAEFNRSVQEELDGTAWVSGCQSWYQQADGRNFSIWPWSTWKYWLSTRHMNEGDFEFFERRPARAEAVPTNDERASQDDPRARELLS